MKTGISFVKQGTLIAAVVFFVACQPPATVDKPASELGVKVTVIDTEASTSDGKVPVVMQFFDSGKYVKLASNATVTCNGVTLVDNGLGPAERVPMQPVGGTYVFQHSRNGVNTTVSVTAPARPVFQAPTVAGATIPRTNNLVIHYVPGSGTSVRGSASDGTNSKNNSQPDDGTHEGMDVSGFNAGSGTLGIVRKLENIHSGGGGFANVESEYSVGSRINITWQ